MDKRPYDLWAEVPKLPITDAIKKLPIPPYCRGVFFRQDVPSTEKPTSRGPRWAEILAKRIELN